MIDILKEWPGVFFRIALGGVCLALSTVGGKDRLVMEELASIATGENALQVLAANFLSCAIILACLYAVGFVIIIAAERLASERVMLTRDNSLEATILFYKFLHQEENTGLLFYYTKTVRDAQVFGGLSLALLVGVTFHSIIWVFGWTPLGERIEFRGLIIVTCSLIGLAFGTIVFLRIRPTIFALKAKVLG